MTTEKRYEILNSLPTYGPMYIPVSESGEPFYSEGFVVRFNKTDGTNWVANIQPGFTDFKQIIEFEHTHNLLVIACGKCYLINPNYTKPISVFGIGYSKLFNFGNNRNVLQDDTGLTIIEPDGSHWNTERISWDGIKVLTVDNNMISGLSFCPTNETEEWDSFTYDLDTRKLKGGSYNIYDKKKWWKLW